LEILTGDQEEVVDADGLHAPVLHIEALDEVAEPVGHEIGDFQVHRLLTGE